MVRIGVLLVILYPSWINAEEKKILNGLQVHGFLSQGYIKTTDTKNDVFGDSSSGKGSFDFREIGVNASHRPITNLQFSMQLLSRQAGESSKGGIRIDYGFLDYTAITSETKELGVRLGRTKNPLGFYNDTRDVPFTRPSILLPQSIYFDRTRNLGMASDGVQIYGESRNDWGDITAQFGVVFPQVDNKNTEAAIFQNSQPGELTPRLSYIGRIIYERDGGRFRFGVSGAQVNAGYDPAEKGDKFSAGSLEFIPLIFSLQYNAERWSFTSEYALRHIDMKNFHNPALDRSFTGESYYFQGIYRFNPQWEAVVRYDAYYADRKDRDGDEWNAFTNELNNFKGGRPAHSRFARDLTLGLRWNITPSIMLRAEYHRVNGTGWLSTLDNPNSTFTDQHWNLFAAQASYRF